MDTADLELTLRLLRDFGVRRAKLEGLEVEFEPVIPEPEAKGFDEQLLAEREAKRRLLADQSHTDIRFPGS
jgi:hypothetical protein